jgi:hypothetical protein
MFGDGGTPGADNAPPSTPDSASPDRGVRVSVRRIKKRPEAVTSSAMATDYFALQSFSGSRVDNCSPIVNNRPEFAWWPPVEG